jgi:hypothetical protein
MLVEALISFSAAGAVVAHQEPTCSQSMNGTKGMSFSGRVLGNLTLDAPAEDIDLICCSIASSFARLRSRNATDPVGFTTRVLGPAIKHPGQLTYNCTTYDYGATAVRTPMPNVTSHMTGPLPPFPPPPPACTSFQDERVCPTSRCFWINSAIDTTCTGCCDNPPITCESGTTDDGALCVHLIINTSQIGPATQSKTTADPNTKVLVAAPKHFSKGRDAWFSFKNGVCFQNKTERFWQWSSEYTAPCLNCAKPSLYLISVGMGLTPAGWDLTPSVGGNLTFGGFWMQSPLVVTATIGDKPDGTIHGAVRSNAGGTISSSVHITQSVL